MPYRDRAVVCLSCRTGMGREELEGIAYARCPTCESVWIGAHALESLLVKMGAESPIEFAARDGERRACPECQATMAPVMLRVAVPVERCEKHGVWFDPAELGVALAAAYLDEAAWWRQFARLVRTFR